MKMRTWLLCAMPPSKMQDESDLFNIQTMDFCGEAIPSIASVAHVDLETNNGQECTHYDYGKLVCEANQLPERDKV